MLAGLYPEAVWREETLYTYFIHNHRSLRNHKIIRYDLLRTDTDLKTKILQNHLFK